jgi:hypothetical protein
MYKITRKYYNSLENVKTIYYTFVNDIKTPYLLVNDILYIKGEETYVPGILDKTIKAFEYVYQNYNNYDYIIRTNISTIVNFDILRHHLIMQNNLEYTGGQTLILSWLDKPAGIVDNKYWGLKYVAGTCIIFSKRFFIKIMKDILYNNKKLDYSIIDDVAIGVFVKENYQNIKIMTMDELYKTNSNYKPKIVFYRNKNDNREHDIINMEKIVNQLLLSKNNITF